MRSVLTVVATLALCGAARAQDLEWLASVEEAKKTKKPVVFLRVLGDMKGRM